MGCILGHARCRLLAVAVMILAANGCVKPFGGSHIDFDLVNVGPLCQQIGVSHMNLPACPKGDTTTYYLELWAVIENSALVRVLNFTVQPVVNPEELLALEEQGARLSTGEQYLVYPPRTIAEHKAAGQYDRIYGQLVKLSTVFAITSYAPKRFAGDSKQLTSEYYVGNSEPLNLPRNGRMLGTVDGSIPFGAGVGQTGGATADVDMVLDRVSNLFVTVESKPPDRTNPVPSANVLMDGRPSSVLRGVTTFEMRSSTSNATGVFNISWNLDDRTYF